MAWCRLSFQRTKIALFLQQPRSGSSVCRAVCSPSSPKQQQNCNVPAVPVSPQGNPCSEMAQQPLRARRTRQLLPKNISIPCSGSFPSSRKSWGNARTTHRFLCSLCAQKLLPGGLFFLLDFLGAAAPGVRAGGPSREGASDESQGCETSINPV